MPDPAIPSAEVFSLGPFQTNCYVIRAAGDDCWIVDAGPEPGPMIGHIRQLGLTPAAVVLTHSHADHIAGLSDIKEAFPDAPVLIHRAEAAFLADPTLNLSVVIGESVVAPAADRLVDGGEMLELGSARWRILSTPGHSPGGITLWSEDAGLALVGDTLFAGSIGRFDFPTSDGPTLFRSIREVLYALPDETRVLPGHGPATTIGREKQSNPFVRP